MTARSSARPASPALFILVNINIVITSLTTADKVTLYLSFCTKHFSVLLILGKLIGLQKLVFQTTNIQMLDQIASKMFLNTMSYDRF